MDWELGIVLSGGGTRGVAHIGVLKALAEHGIEPDAVSGTSSGAIVGALWAAGYGPEEMLEFFEKRNPFKLSKLTLRKPGLIDTGKVVSDFRDYFPEDRFEALDKKLFVTATDIVEARMDIFDSGPLIAPVLASSAFPGVFTPTEIDGHRYADGGILANFPIEPLLGRCHHILGVYATPLRAIHEKDLDSMFEITQRALEVGMYFTAKIKFEKCDVVISPAELSKFGTFETRKLHEICEIGYEATLERMDEIERVLGSND